MKRKTIIILVLSILLLGLISFLLINNSVKEEDYFSQIELSNKNFITNTTINTFYDTIISVGLDEAGISGVNVVVSELSSGAKEKFDYGELKAHIRYFEGRFYLFIEPLNRRKSITVIAHEIVHMKQYLDGTFQYENGKITWNGQDYLLEDITYNDRPWETEAFQLESQLASQISDVIYQ